MPFSRRAILAVLLLFLPLSAAAQERGTLSGRVTDKKTGHAIPFASVTVMGAKLGALTDSKGEFLVRNVPVGAYEVRVQFLGYKPESRPDVTISPNRVTVANFPLEEIVVRQEKVVEVTGERPLVQLNQGSTVRTVTSAEIEKLPVRTINQVLEQQTGVSSDADQLHVRGGRSDETVFVVDGVVNRDLIGGGSTAGTINARSVAEVSVATGGFDAKYGQAISGVVDVKLKEGREKFEGGFSYSTGYHGLNLYSAVLSGPEPITQRLLPSLGVRIPGTVTFLLDASGDFTSTRFPSVEDLPGQPRLISGYEKNIFGVPSRLGSWLMPTEDNTWRGLLKLTWRPNPRNKFETSASTRLAIDQGFARRNITDVTGLEPTYPWAWSHRIDHAQTVTEDNESWAVAWTRILANNRFFNLQFSRYYLALHQDVLGKHWSEYERPDDFSLIDPAKRDDYFIDTGDDNTWHDRRTLSYSTLGGYTHHLRNHKIEAGFQHDFQTVQYVTIEDPWDYDPDGLGSSHDIWRIHPWQGNVFVQDRLEYEGFIANLGLRADYWVVGREVERAVADTTNSNITPATREAFFSETDDFFGRRYKAHLSPRIWVSHPITERSKFFFNYGQFTQFPSYLYVYSKLTSISSESFPVLGNPSLNPQISVQYEVGGNAQTSDHTAVNLTFFMKDVYDYPTSTRFQRQQGTSLTDVLVYLNGDFARTKGFELEFEKRRSGFWSARASYSFSQATGKGSDPNEAKILEESGGDASETRLGEAFVYWNRPHKASLSLDLRFDAGNAPKNARWLRDAGVNFFVLGQSGRAYTPASFQTAQAAKPYSKNAPFAVTVDTRLNKQFIMSGQRLNIAIFGRNIFDAAVPRRIDPYTGRGYELGEGQFAPDQMPTDPDAYQYVIDSRLSNPSNYEEGANWRVSVDYDF
jgi:hypothetical protein